MWHLLLCQILLVVLGCTCSEVDSDAAISNVGPMLVSVRYDCQRTSESTTHCCTGTILSESYVLTAAGCVNQLDYDGMTVVAGFHNPFSAEQMIRTIDRIIIHPNRTSDPDRSNEAIALLHLSKPLNFIGHKYIAPVYLSGSTMLEKNIINDASKTNRHFLITSGNPMEMRRDRPTEIRLLNQNDPMCQSWAADVDLQCFVTLNDSQIGSSSQRRPQSKYRSFSFN
jgi:secreted trypsin-like serine protease